MLLHNGVTAEQYLRLNLATKYDNKALYDKYLPEGWNLLEQSGETDDWHGYYGRAYVQGDQIVVSSRGSVDLDDDLQYSSYMQKGYNFFADYLVNNVHGVFFFRGPWQISSAEHFYLHINQTYGRDFKISMTGFSLGGTLAKAVSYTYGLPCVAVDSPGEMEILAQLNIKPSEQAKIININSSPNIVNTHGTYLKPPLYISVPYGTNSTGVLNFVADVSSTHSMEKMLKYLPKGLKQASYWPKIEEAYNNFKFTQCPTLQKKWTLIKSFLSHDHNISFDIDSSRSVCDKQAGKLRNNLQEKLYNVYEYCDEFIEFLDQKTTNNIYFRAAADVYEDVTDAVSSCYHSVTGTFGDLGRSFMNLIGDNNNNESN